MPDLSHACDLHHSSWQRRILNSLSEARVEPVSSWMRVRFVSHVPRQELLKMSSRLTWPLGTCSPQQLRPRPFQVPSRGYARNSLDYSEGHATSPCASNSNPFLDEATPLGIYAPALIMSVPRSRALAELHFEMTLALACCTITEQSPLCSSSEPLQHPCVCGKKKKKKKNKTALQAITRSCLRGRNSEDRTLFT